MKIKSREEIAADALLERAGIDPWSGLRRVEDEAEAAAEDTILVSQLGFELTSVRPAGVMPF